MLSIYTVYAVMCVRESPPWNVDIRVLTDWTLGIRKIWLNNVIDKDQTPFHTS